MKITLTDKQKGSLYMLGGLILLFHTLGILRKGLDYLIVIGSVGAIVYGFIEIDGMTYIKKFLTLKKK